MSIHPSFKNKNKNKKSVRSRLERFQKLLEEEKWKEGDSIFALSKEKVIRLKRKKTEKEEIKSEGEISTLPSVETNTKRS